MKEECYHLGVKAIIYNNKGDVLLLRVNLARTTHKKVPYWDIPGGRVERGSTVQEALLRELEEETGIDI